MISKDTSVNTQTAKGDRLCLQIPALPVYVGKARHAVADFLHHQGWQEHDTDAVMLAVGEAGSNAVSYGGEDGAATVCIICTLIQWDQLEIEVRNQGTHFQPNLHALCALPDADATHGRGFALMNVLMDDVKVYHDGPETVVRLTKSRSH